MATTVVPVAGTTLRTTHTCCGGAIRLPLSKRCKPLVKCHEGMAKGGLLGEWKADRSRRLHPWRRRPVDGAALRFGDFSPGIAVRRMQPAAAEVERTGTVKGPCPTAKARSCL